MKLLRSFDSKEKQRNPYTKISLSPQKSTNHLKAYMILSHIIKKH